MTLPTFLMVWLPDSILLFFFSDQRLTPLGGYAIYPEWLDNFRRTIGAALWPLIIMVVGVRKSEGLSWIKVILAVLFTFIPAAILTLVLSGKPFLWKFNVCLAVNVIIIMYLFSIEDMMFHSLRSFHLNWCLVGRATSHIRGTLYEISPL